MEQRKKLVALIPIRAGSKGILQKNVKTISKAPLFIHTVLAAIASEYIDKVYISTDIAGIDRILNEYIGGMTKKLKSKVSVVSRPAEICGDNSSTESVMLNIADNFEFDNIILLQATNPLVTTNDINNGIELFSLENYDSVLSVAKMNKFLWNKGVDNQGIPINYDYYKRPFRNEVSEFYIENGSFYITSKQLLQKSKCRISGKIGMSIMSSYSINEIDEPLDWKIVEECMANKYLLKVSKIKMLAFDCDGVLTDGKIMCGADDKLKSFSTLDGMGIQLLKENGIKSVVITSESIDIDLSRFEKLKIDEIHIGVEDKLKLINELSQKYDIRLDEIAYVGNDINDFQIMCNVGISFAPADAQPIIRLISDVQLQQYGGAGVVREAIDFLLVKNFAIN